VTEPKLSLAQARRIALRAQGFQSKVDYSRTQPGWRQLKSALCGMGALQIDAINTVIRSHYTPLFSRLGPYDRGLLDQHIFRPRRVPGDRAFFEYWGHECSVLPLSTYPLFRWRMDDARTGVGVYKQLSQLAAEKPDFIHSVRDKLEAKPMTCRDLSVDRRGPGMWEWSESKQALEYLFATGDIATTGRRRFERVYGLPQCVFPADLLEAPAPTRVAAQASLLEIAAVAMGVATAADLRDYFRLSAVDADRALDILLDQRRLLRVHVEGWTKPAYRVPGTKIPRNISVATLLSPFDPVVWNRERASRLFNFDYRIEIYVPAAKRRYGYWVMPFLLDDQLVARVDLKAEREQQRLLVKGAWFEPAARGNDDIAPALRQALERLATWLDLSQLEITANGDLGRALI